MANQLIKRKSKFKSFPYLFNAAIFFVGGLWALEEERFYFTLIVFVTALVNLLVIKTDDKNLANSIVMVLNAILALIIGIEFVFDDKKYIQYVWFVSFLISFVVAIISFSKYKKAKQEASQPPLSEENSTRE